MAVYLPYDSQEFPKSTTKSIVHAPDRIKVHGFPSPDFAFCYTLTEIPFTETTEKSRNLSHMNLEVENIVETTVYRESFVFNKFLDPIH